MQAGQKNKDYVEQALISKVKSHDKQSTQN